MLWLISVPKDADPKKKDLAWESLKSKVAESRFAEVYRFEVPSLKVGTFDQLIGLSDELVKMDTQVESVVRKIERQLKDLSERNTAPVVKDKPAEEYLRGFAWDQFRYPPRAQLRELVDAVQKQVVTLDEELKEKAGDLNSKKQQFQAVARSATGNLLVRSLDSVIKPEVLVDTEYLVSVFVVVNDHSVDAFMKEYESLNNWVVPRSAIEVTREEDLVLFRVVIFKKVLADFKTSAREKRYTVREHTPAEGGEGGAADGEKARTALKDAIEKQQKSLTRWCIINYSEVFQAWTHLKTIRVFVESVLRYGLPANFESALLKPVKKNDRKLRQLLEQTYRHLGSGGKAADEPQGEAFYPYVSIDVNVDGENPHEL